MTEQEAESLRLRKAARLQAIEADERKLCRNHLSLDWHATAAEKKRLAEARKKLKKMK